MIKVVPLHAAGTPTRWVLAFYRTSESKWVRRLVPGRYKHVAAFGYIAAMDCWVFFDCRRQTIDIIAARGDSFRVMLEHYAKDADLLGMDRRPGIGRGFRIGFWCVPAIKHLLGLRSGALRPSSLWIDCVRQGAEILSDEKFIPAAAAGLRPAAA